MNLSRDTEVRLCPGPQQLGLLAWAGQGGPRPDTEGGGWVWWLILAQGSKDVFSVLCRGEVETDWHPFKSHALPMLSIASKE